MRISLTENFDVPFVEGGVVPDTKPDLCRKLGEESEGRVFFGDGGRGRAQAKSWCGGCHAEDFNG
jgi:mono/diheme cytochrome c family protein